MGGGELRMGRMSEALASGLGPSTNKAMSCCESQLSYLNNEGLD